MRKTTINEVPAAVLARLRAWNPFHYHTFAEVKAHEADLAMLPDDGGAS